MVYSLGCVMSQTRDRLSIPMHQVDAHNVVPVWEASDKKETAARTIRKKIHTKLPMYLTVCKQTYSCGNSPYFHLPAVVMHQWSVSCFQRGTESCTIQQNEGGLLSAPSQTGWCTDLQDFPDIPKQKPWMCKRMPDKIDWDGLIAEVLQRGTDVPEVPWFKPGEDAAYDVSSADSASFNTSLVDKVSCPIWNSSTGFARKSEETAGQSTSCPSSSCLPASC